MALAPYFGNTPRVRVMEAILRLAPLDSFSMKDVAREAQLFPPSTYRTIRQLAKEGFLEKSEIVYPQRFHVPKGSPHIQLLALIDAAVGQITGRTQTKNSVQVVAKFASLAGAVGRSQKVKGRER